MHITHYYIGTFIIIWIESLLNPGGWYTCSLHLVLGLWYYCILVFYCALGMSWIIERIRLMEGGGIGVVISYKRKINLLKGLVLFPNTKHNVHRFALNLHSLKIMIVESFPRNVTLLRCCSFWEMSKSNNFRLVLACKIVLTSYTMFMVKQIP